LRCCVVIAVVVGVRYASKPEGSIAVAVAFGLLYVSMFWGDDRYTGVSDYCLSSWLVSGMAARSVIMLGRGRECKYMYHNPPTVDTWMTSGGERSLELLVLPHYSGYRRHGHYMCFHLCQHRSVLSTSSLYMYLMIW